MRCLIHWVHGFAARFAPGIGTHWVTVPTGLRFPLGARRGGIDARRDGAIHGGAAQSIIRASGSMGAGEGRSEVGRWPGSITNPVKIF